MGKPTFEVGGREFPKVSWWNMKGMRGTYLTLWAALITSATNGRWTTLPSHLYTTLLISLSICLGYDGSLINGLQAMDEWKESQFSSALGPVAQWTAVTEIAYQSN